MLPAHAAQQPIGSGGQCCSNFYPNVLRNGEVLVGSGKSYADDEQAGKVENSGSIANCSGKPLSLDSKGCGGAGSLLFAKLEGRRGKASLISMKHMH